ncbi:MAG: DUF4230 domain-containing protein [Clostridia bacterium]|nr:DUF4230 domain-containing protein [Clostridia bacterium]
MKWLGKKAMAVLLLALAIMLAATFYPYAQEWVSSMLPQGKYDRATTVISHEMEKAGELTAVKYTDQELMESSTKALFLGEVQNVKAPYTYEIGLGIHLNEVKLTASENGITVAVPDVEMLYDSFRVTGSPEVKDFFHPLNETKYQQMLDAQAAECRAKYLDDQQCLSDAWTAACESIERLISQWTGEEIPLKFTSVTAS